MALKVLLASPLSALNGVLIRFDKAVRKPFKVGSVLLRSFKGPVLESGGNRPEKRGVLIRFPLPLVENVQMHEGEKSVRGTTGGKYRPIIRLHDLEEDLLPYLDGNMLH